MTVRISKTKPRGLELAPLDEDGHRWALMRDGIVIMTGSREDCRQRLAILTPVADDRARQDGALRRACW